MSARALRAGEVAPTVGRTPVWEPVLDPERAAAARCIAHEVARRLRDRERLEAAIEGLPRQTAFPQVVRWYPGSIAQGNAGLALACGALDDSFPGEGWELVAHDHLVVAARACERDHAHLPLGLFSGLTGTAFAVWYLARGGVRYRRLLATFDAEVAMQARMQARSLRRQSQGVMVSQYDVISGLAGVATYLVSRCAGKETREALHEVLAALVDLSTEREGVPGWHSPPLLLDERMRGDHPGGNVNCGLAHGMPGALSAMALGLLAGVEVPGLGAALDRAAAWLAQHRCDDAWGINWPNAVSLEPVAEPAAASRRLLPANAAPHGASRAAWCYGAPGVARALWLAGEALGDDGYRRLAVAAMEAIYRRPLSVRAIDSPTFCHGISGLLQVTLRFAVDTGGAVFVTAARALVDQLLENFERRTLLGFRSHEPRDGRVDHPGLLDGAAGVMLPLLAAAGHVNPTWDRVFLLS